MCFNEPFYDGWNYRRTINFQGVVFSNYIYFSSALYLSYTFHKSNIKKLFIYFLENQKPRNCNKFCYRICRSRALSLRVLASHHNHRRLAINVITNVLCTRLAMHQRQNHLNKSLNKSLSMRELLKRYASCAHYENVFQT